MGTIASLLLWSVLSGTPVETVDTSGANAVTEAGSRFQRRTGSTSKCIVVGAAPRARGKGGKQERRKGTEKPQSKFRFRTRGPRVWGYVENLPNGKQRFWGLPKSLPPNLRQSIIVPRPDIKYHIVVVRPDSRIHYK